MIIAGIDLETGGSFKDPLEKNFITEIGIVLYDVEEDACVEVFNSLINPQEQISAEALEYTKISQYQVETYGRFFDNDMRAYILNLLDKADYLLAHNGLRFDFPLLEQPKYLGPLNKIKIDSMIDIEYPNNCRSTNLTYLQCFHGFAYPGHRTIMDVMAMFKIFKNYDLNSIIASASSPLVKVIANVGFADKDKAKEANFYWNPDSKFWFKEMRQINIPKHSDNWKFSWRIENEEN